MKVCLQVFVDVEIPDGQNPDEIGLYLPTWQAFPIKLETGEKIGEIIGFTTDGVIFEND